MVSEVRVPPFTGNDLESLIRWVRLAAPAINQAVDQIANGGAFFVWNDGCVTIPTSTTISGAEEIVFTSPFAGNGTLLITGVGFEGGVTADLNGTNLGTFTDVDTTNPITYEAAVINIIEGFNSFKIWSTTSDTGELRKLEARGIDVGGFRAFGALASQSTISEDVQILEPGGAEARRISNAVTRIPVTDGQTVTFDPARGEIPNIEFTVGGVGTPDPSGNLAGEQWWPDVHAENVDLDGFDVVAVFRILGSSETDTTDASATGDSTSWVIEKSIAAEANNDTYTYQYDVTVNAAQDIGLPGENDINPSKVTLAFDTREVIAGAWTERAVAQFSNFDPDNAVTFLNKTKAVVVDGLDADAAFRVRVKSEVENGGSIPAFDQVTYSSGGGPTTETMTPGIGEEPIVAVITGGAEETAE